MNLKFRHFHTLLLLGISFVTTCSAQARPLDFTKFFAIVGSPKLYHTAQITNATATAMDIGITAKYLSRKNDWVFLGNPQGFTPNPVNLTSLFREGGVYKFVGDRSPVKIGIAAAVGEAGLFLIAHEFAKHGNWGRAVATSILIAETFAHIQGFMSWYGYSNRLLVPYQTLNQQPMWITH